MRTAEQLGYLVTHGLREKGVLTGARFMIQSERDPIHLDSRIEAFLNETIPLIFEKMTQNDFNLHCSALKLDLTQKKKTLASESKQHWDSILSGSNDFKRPWIDANDLNSISIDDLKDFYENYFKNCSGNNQRAKVAVHIWSKVALKSYEIDQIDYYKNLNSKKTSKGSKILVIQGDRDAFVQSMELYPCVYKPTEE